MLNNRYRAPANSTAPTLKETELHKALLALGVLTSGLCETLPSSFVPRFKTAFQRVERFLFFFQCVSKRSIKKITKGDRIGRGTSQCARTEYIAATLRRQQEAWRCAFAANVGLHAYLGYTNR